MLETVSERRQDLATAVGSSVRQLIVYRLLPLRCRSSGTPAPERLLRLDDCLHLGQCAMLLVATIKAMGIKIACPNPRLGKVIYK